MMHSSKSLKIAACQRCDWQVWHFFLYEISKDYAIMMKPCDWQGRDNITGRLRSVLVVAGLLITQYPAT